MKILMLADVFFPDTIGGAGRVAYHLSDELSKRGHDIHVMTRRTTKELPAYEALNSHLFAHRFNAPEQGLLNLFLSEIKSSYLLAKRLAHEMSFDLVCSHQALAAIGPLINSSLKQIPAVHYFYSPWHEEFLIKKQEDASRPSVKTQLIALLMKLIERKIMLRAKRIIPMSQYMTDKIQAIHNISTDKTIKIPGGVDLNGFSLPINGKTTTKTASRFPLDKTVFLTVRNLVPRMGLEALIEAFSNSSILRQNGFLLIGGRGPLEGKLKALVAHHTAQQSIRFLGHIPEESLPRMYQAADFFVLPTRKLEGFGLVILEAMACGTPVLGTPVGSIPELIRLFDKKLMFNGTGWQDMKMKMEEVIESPEAYSYDAAACRRFVEQDFSWKSVAESFEQEVIKCVEEGRKRQK